MVFSTHQLAALIEAFGNDHVLIGTDYPFDMAEADPIGHIASIAGISTTNYAAIAGENAKRLLGL